MASDESTLRELCDEKGWAPIGEVTTTPTATFAPVETDEGAETRVLWLWRTTAGARRNEVALSRAYAGQLFAAPPLVEKGEQWTLTESIEGVPFETHLEEVGVDSIEELSSEKQRQLCKSAGTLARKLHEIEVESAYGDLLDEDASDLAGFAGRWQTFNGYCASRLEHFAEEIRRLDFDEETRSTLLKSIGDLRNELSAFHPRHPPALNHGNLVWEHLWVSEDGDEVVGISDFSRARLLPPEADLARILWLNGIANHERLIRSFYDGYGAARTMDLQRRERFYRRLAAFEALVDDAAPSVSSDERLVELTMV